MFQIKSFLMSNNFYFESSILLGLGKPINITYVHSSFTTPSEVKVLISYWLQEISLKSLIIVLWKMHLSLVTSNSCTIYNSSGKKCIILQGNRTLYPSVWKLGMLKYSVTRKYPLRGYIVGVLTHTTAWDRHWRGDKTLNWVLIYLSSLVSSCLIL